MSGLRDTFVAISMQDNATNTLNSINRLMDRIGNNFRRFGEDVDGSTSGFRDVSNGVNRLNRNLNDSTEEITLLNRRISDSENEMTGLRNESRRLESELRGARDEIETMEERIRRAERETESLRDEMRRVGDETNRAEGSMSFFGTTAGKVVGLLGAAFAVDKIKDFGVSALESAASTQAMQAQFDQVFEGAGDSATTSLKKIAEETGMLQSRLTGSFTQMAAFAKTTGMKTTDALSLTERATIAAADSAAFYDKSIEEVSESLQSYLKGNFANDAALGISSTETTRNAAANKLYSKSFKDLSESQKQMTLLQMVEDGNKLSGALGQAAKESDAWENQLGNMKTAWDDLKGTLATPFLDTVTGGMQTLTTAMQKVDAEGIGNKLKSGFDSVMQIAVPIFNGLKKAVGWVGDELQDTFGGDVVSSFVNQVIVPLMPVAQQFIGTAMQFIRNTVSGGLNIFNILKGTVVGLINNVIVPLFPVAQSIIQTAFGIISPILRIAGGLFRGVSSIVKFLVEQVFVPLFPLISTTVETVWGVVEPIFGFISGALSGIADSVEWVIDKFSSFGEAAKNLNIGEKIGGVVSWVGGALSGSHATGLENVPYDGYTAELHKGEAVLTAKQSNALRSAGMLTENADGTPSLNMGGGNSGTVQQGPASSGGGNQIIFNISGENAGDIAQKVREVLSDILGEEMQIN